MNRKPGRREVRRATAALAGSFIVGVVAMVTASPAMAVTPAPGAAPIPGLAANCPVGVPPGGNAVSSPTGTAAGFSVTAPGGNCTSASASASVASATKGAVTFGAIQAVCTVDPFTSQSHVVLTSDLGPLSPGDYSGFQTVTTGGKTYVFNKKTATGVTALTINGVPFARVGCPALYPLKAATVTPTGRSASANLGNAQNAGLVHAPSSSGHSVSSVLLLILAVGGLVIINVAGLRAFRLRDHKS